MMDREREGTLKKLERQFDLRFKNLSYLNQALTHSSYINENRLKGIEDNEKLEFLGDAVLGMIISDYLWRELSFHKEGELSKIKAALVSEAVLARKSRELKLGDYLLLGRGEKSSGGRERTSILANTFEALVGAIYLDRGLEFAVSFVLDQLKDEIASVKWPGFKRDYKTLLQEFSQKKFKEVPSYEVIKESGPHHQRIFEVVASLKGKIYGRGKGRSKKEAEQEAAREALSTLKGEVGE